MWTLLTLSLLPAVATTPAAPGAAAASTAPLALPPAAQHAEPAQPPEPPQQPAGIELQAFQLADQSSAVNASATDWQLSTELALASNRLPGAAEQSWQSRLALDSRFSQSSADQTLYLRWHSRLDGFANDAAGADHSSAVLSWKELYGGYRWNDSWLTEVGRINQKNGVARGANPTDFFATSAVRAQISQQPAVLREQRLGSLMLRQQWLGSNHALSLLYSPKLSSRPDDAPLAADWARTNSNTRWQLSAEQQLQQGWTLGLIYFQQQTALPQTTRQYGINLSGALNERWLFHTEVAHGEQSDGALNGHASSADSSRLASGLSYSLTVPLTLTLEWHYDGAALTQQSWQQLLQTPDDWLHYLQQRQGQSPTRQRLMLQAQSQQWFTGFDWSALWFHDLQDNSDMLLTELTWIKPEYDIVLQWQWAPGPARSHFGALSSQLQLLWRYYL